MFNIDNQYNNSGRSEMDPRLEIAQKDSVYWQCGLCTYNKNTSDDSVCGVCDAQRSLYPSIIKRERAENEQSTSPNVYNNVVENEWNDIGVIQDSSAAEIAEKIRRAEDIGDQIKSSEYETTILRKKIENEPKKRRKKCRRNERL